jgi:hypothetical protein
MIKPWKVITQDNGQIEIYGNGHFRPLLYFWDLSPEQQTFVKSEYDYLFDDPNDCDGVFFVYKGWTYSLDNFMNIHNTVHNPNPPKWMLEFDGYLNDTFFSGILIKLVQYDFDEAVKVYTFIS